MHAGREDKGAALILAMVFVSVLAAFSASVLYEGYTKSRAVALSGQAAQNHLLAEAALATARDDLDNAGTGGVGTLGWGDWDGDGHADWNEVKDLANGTVPFAGGHYWFQVTQLDPTYKRITAYGRMDSGPGGRRDANGDVQLDVARVEMIVKGTITETHPAFTGKYAIFVGDDLTLEGVTAPARGYYCETCGAGPLSFFGRYSHRSATGHGSFRYESGGANGDQIEGDVYVDGQIELLGDSHVAGTAETTDVDPVGAANADGGIVTLAEEDEIPPPDFVGMDYRNSCDINVGDAFTQAEADDTLYVRPKSSCAYTERENIVDSGVTTLPADNPAHIFAKESFTDDAMDNTPTDATNYQWGDWVSSSDGETTVIQSNGNHRSYFVPGNLWIDPQGYGGTMGLAGNPSDDGAQITVIVEGNIYIGDEMRYAGALDGIAFVAVQARGQNGDPISRAEGSGNILFGDLNAQARDPTVNALLFAENDFLDIQKGSGGSPLEFTLNGLMASGGSLVLNRGTGTNHTKMTVRHDQRLLDGDISLPDLPPPLDGTVASPPGPPWVPVARWQAR